MSEESAESVRQLVVVGASAGGIEALSTLVAHLPTDCPAPIVIAQHLSPERDSHLPQILAARSTLPIEVVTTTRHLRPGVVYVVPSNRDVEIDDHMVTVTRDREPGPMPSIDLLLSSAARVFGENLIAVILTGMGADGAAGARVVKAAGGMVIIQNPETANFPAMPRSLAPTTVDIVAELDAIGALLGQLLSPEDSLLLAEPEVDLRTLLEETRDRTGIDFSAYKMATIQRRLQRRMIATGTTTLGEYSALLEQTPEEFQRLASSFLIKVTEFFRNPELFEYLREHVLPELIQSAEARGELRLWSAGCATGEEAYSLAMLVAEMLGDDAKLTVRIYATDVDSDAINFARQGVYPESALANLPRELAERFFTYSDGQCEVRKNVRTMVVFGQHDLGVRAPFPQIDLVCCRNVLIYFTPELQRRALQLFAFSLRDRGFLVLGKAESATPLSEYFAPEDNRLKVYRRVGERIVIPMTRVQADASMQSMRGANARRAQSTHPRPLTPRQPAARAQPTPGELFAGILDQLPTGVVVVDRQYRILLINIVARRLLGVHSAALGEDLMHLVQHGPLLSIRNAINAAFRGEQSTFQTQVQSDQNPSQSIDLEISCNPGRVQHEGLPADAVTISVLDVSRFVGAMRQRDEEISGGRVQIAALLTQAEQAIGSYAQLLEANEQLTTIITELHIENEELLLTNEEVRSATEEVETLNEEMQATNEELETLNEELQATIEELNTTYDDLHARTVELQGVNIMLDEQRLRSEMIRARLLAVLDTVRLPVIVIGSHRQVTMTNTACRERFGMQAGDERSLSEQLHIIEGGDHLEHRAAAGEEFSSVIIVDTGEDGPRRYEARSVTIDEPGSDWRSVIILTALEDS